MAPSVTVPASEDTFIWLQTYATAPSSVALHALWVSISLTLSCCLSSMQRSHLMPWPKSYLLKSHALLKMTLHKALHTLPESKLSRLLKWDGIWKQCLAHSRFPEFLNTLQDISNKIFYLLAYLSSFLCVYYGVRWLRPYILDHVIS